MALETKDLKAQARIENQTVKTVHGETQRSEYEVSFCKDDLTNPKYDGKFFLCEKLSSGFFDLKLRTR